MNHDSRIQFFNIQEEVSGVLKHNDSNRLVCAKATRLSARIS
ncbi:MAG: hypothetical protein P4L92_05675 [Rudaea sp.]|nr:hypothetical protein [Rudaea sp.]